MKMLQVLDGFCAKIAEDDVEDAVLKAILAQKTPKDGRFHRGDYPKLAFFNASSGELPYENVHFSAFFRRREA
ncbi:MAG: hypothetical protein ACM3JI_06010 [Anaerolineae bacterium]